MRVTELSDQGARAGLGLGRGEGESTMDGDGTEVAEAVREVRGETRVDGVGVGGCGRFVFRCLRPGMGVRGPTWTLGDLGIGMPALPSMVERHHVR
jgi:hypothetical protein